MTNKNKQKGNDLERYVVTQFKLHGIDAKRAWGSHGESLGEHKDVDVLVPSQELPSAVEGNTIVLDKIKIQCKKRKQMPKYLGMSQYVDAVVFAEDYGEKYILLRLDQYLRDLG